MNKYEFIELKIAFVVIDVTKLVKFWDKNSVVKLTNCSYCLCV